MHTPNLSYKYTLFFTTLITLLLLASRPVAARAFDLTKKNVRDLEAAYARGFTSGLSNLGKPLSNAERLARGLAPRRPDLTHTGNAYTT